jgi:TolA-binding protein
LRWPRLLAGSAQRSARAGGGVPQKLYDSGRFREAEAAAQPLIAQAAASADPAVRAQGARARRVQAFAAARRRDFPLARQRFALLWQEAARLPDRGKQAASPGENPPTLEAEAAYQHAVLTAALGDTQAAEAEFKRFIRQYPESPLVHAAVQRIGKLHGGNVMAIQFSVLMPNKRRQSVV